MSSETESGPGTIVYTDYRSGDAKALLDYIERDHAPIHDRTGREMSEAQRREFIDKSSAHNFQRQVVISPENRHDLSAEDFHRATRDTVKEFARDRRTTTYAYAVHREMENHPHVHVAMTGERRELYMNRDDIQQFREQSHERFIAREEQRRRDFGRKLEEDTDRQRREDRERLAELKREAKGLTREEEQEREQGRGHSRGF